MLFNSYEYIFVFLPLALTVYFWLNKRRLITAARTWLGLASLAFYSWWGYQFLPLIIFSILVNFGIGSALGLDTVNYKGHRPLSRRLILTAGIIFNLGLLGYFKYANFFVNNLNIVAGTSFQLEHIALPLAISFFTFQKIAYLVDSYKNETRGYDFLNYVLFVTFFPQLIAGPIVHHKQIIPQFANRWNLMARWKNISLGLAVFGFGLFKKVIIADSFALWATPGFDDALALSFSQAWVTSLSYTFQLYFDFSGYTDMALGSALLFNIRLPINFNSPYKALNIQDFWRRWHITLSCFLRDYLYIPLGGSRKSEFQTYINLCVTFLLGGLWHGASWMFVVWGCMHGGALVIHRIWSRTGLRLPAVPSWFLTFFFVNLTWVFFRAKDLTSAKKVIYGMFGLADPAPWSDLLALWRSCQRWNDCALNLLDLTSGGIENNLQIVAMIIGSFALVCAARPTLEFCLQHRNSTFVYALSGIAFGTAITAMYSASTRASEFLYFNF